MYCTGIFAKKMDKEAPLPLSELRDRVSADTYAWLESEDAKEAAWQEELKETAADRLFAADAEEEDDDEERIREWSSSSSQPDGVGGYDGASSETQKLEEGAVRVVYILSSASGGHGDDLWAASRHISNLLADAEKCRQLLLLSSDRKPGFQHHHPLVGLNFIELGAGGGVPAWTAMHCGARVVCTDQTIPNRIRCIAECAERNLRSMRKSLAAQDEKLIYANQGRACPYDWGSSIRAVTRILDGDEVRFDVVLAADCIYMPEYHEVLLDSIQMLLAKDGVALLPFALHGNTKDDNVWSIVEVAKSKGFKVDTLEAQQLTPQALNMHRKRGLVHTLRLTRI